MPDANRELPGKPDRGRSSVLFRVETLHGGSAFVSAPLSFFASQASFLVSADAKTPAPFPEMWLLSHKCSPHSSRSGAEDTALTDSRRVVLPTLGAKGTVTDESDPDGQRCASRESPNPCSDFIWGRSSTPSVFILTHLTKRVCISHNTLSVSIPAPWNRFLNRGGPSQDLYPYLNMVWLLRGGRIEPRG